MNNNNDKRGIDKNTVLISISRTEISIPKTNSHYDRL